MKKQYKKPATLVVELQHQGQMLQSSPAHIDAVKNVSSNLDPGDVFDLGGDEHDGDDEEYFDGGGGIR